jgi:hypothetical protein
MAGVNFAVVRQLLAQPLYLQTLRDGARPATPSVQLLAADPQEFDLVGEDPDDALHSGVVEGAGPGQPQDALLLLGCLELAVADVSDDGQGADLGGFFDDDPCVL